MKRVERVARGIAVLLVVYSFFLAQGLRLAIREGRTAPETFPFFVWELFSRVPPSEQVNFALRFTEMDGERLEAPLYFERAHGRLPSSRSPDAQRLIREIGKAINNKEEMRVALQRDVLEARFMQPLTEAEYEIVEVRFDLLERLECDCYIAEVPLASFTLSP